MGNLEKRNRKRRGKENLQKIILSSVATASILSIGLVAPNVLSALSKLGVLPSPRRREYISSSASKLVKRRLMKLKDGYYQLKNKGERMMRRGESPSLNFIKPLFTSLDAEDEIYSR